MHQHRLDGEGDVQDALQSTADGLDEAVREKVMGSLVCSADPSDSVITNVQIDSADAFLRDSEGNLADTFTL